MMSNWPACFDALARVLPFDYAQWLQVDANLDYRMIAQHIPPGTLGYEIAHRTGVIGQVFRRGQAVFIPDGATNDLYDTFDPMITWELAVPLFSARQLVGVLNLEGRQAPILSSSLWSEWVNVVKRKTSLESPSTPPVAGNNRLVPTRYLDLQGACSDGEDERRLARFAAAGGADVLLVGPLQYLDDGRFPNLETTLAQGLAPAESVRGLESGIDGLPTGKLSPQQAKPLLQSMASGRYHLVLWADRSNRPQE